MTILWRKNHNLQNPSTNNGSGLGSTLISLSSWDTGHKALISRLLFLIIFLGICFLSIGYKLIIVATASPTAKNIYSKGDYFRREIVDRNGVLLAINVPGSSAYANPKKMIDINDAVERLTKNVAGIDKNRLIKDLKETKTFTWIKRDLTAKEQKTIHDLGIPGIYFETEAKRVYTQGSMLSHLIGYVGRDNDGLAGLESSYNKFLTEKNIPNKDDSEPLRLTIDSRIQNIVREELSATISTFRAAAGLVVIADPNNGEIIAAVSMPDYNPHNPSKASPDQMFNRYSLGVYEFGSIMKVLTLAIGLDTDKVHLNDAYDLTSMKVAKFNIQDYHKEVGFHSVPEIFLHSSNIGMAQIVLETGKPDFKKYIDRLGLTEKLAIEIPEKASPLVPKYDKWTDLSMATMSYGYAMSISPLHFMNAGIPVVNGGIMYPIHFVKREDPIVGTQVLKTSTSEDMNKLLRLVVSKGTGKKSEVKGYFVGAKTGTAQKREGKHYVKNKRDSSFFAVVPASKPKYAILIMLDNPQPTKETFGFATAGWTAAPLAKNIISRMVTLYGISPYSADEDAKIEEELHVEYQIDEEA